MAPMQVYRISPEKVQFKLEKTRLRRVLVAIASVIAAHLFLVYKLFHDDRRLAVGGIVVIAALAAYSTRRIIRKDAIKPMELFRSYEIEDDGIALKRRQSGSPEVTVPYWEMRKLEEVRGGGLWIRTDDRRLDLWIPMVLEGYEDLKQKLRMSTPAEFVLSRRLTPGGALLSLAFCAAMVVLAVSQDKLLVLAAALFAIGFIVWGVILIFRSSQSNRKLKWKSIAGLALISLACIERVVSLWM